ncbi:MAG TPA: hypothetical protein VM166_05325, partial [Gemmatimonadaceae bacterium]|nr:hypothetical protein [Gemmatimonadaceae bacterium]
EKSRPQYLRTRGKTTTKATTIERAIVFMDGVPYGVISSLRGINVAQITVIQFYPGSDAVTRFGLGNASGAIEVTTDAQP